MLCVDLLLQMWWPRPLPPPTTHTLTPLMWRCTPRPPCPHLARNWIPPNVRDPSRSWWQWCEGTPVDPQGQGKEVLPIKSKMPILPMSPRMTKLQWHRTTKCPQWFPSTCQGTWGRAFLWMDSLKRETGKYVIMCQIITYRVFICLCFVLFGRSSSSAKWNQHYLTNSV